MSRSPTFRNPLVNGNFAVRQRGDALSIGGGHVRVADNWTTYSAAAFGTRTINYFAIPNGAGTRNWMRVTRNTGNAAPDAVSFAQTLESADSVRFQGKLVTVSFTAVKFAYTPTGSALSFTLYSGTGTDQPNRNAVAFTGDSTVFTKTVNLTGGYVRYSGTGLVPSNCNQLGLVFATGAYPASAAPANDCFDIGEIQIEMGSVATRFEQRPQGLELSLCQRYYNRWAGDGGNSVILGSGVMWNLVNGQVILPFPVPMRTAALPVIGGAASSFNLLTVANDPLTALSGQISSTKAAYLNTTIATNRVTGGGCVLAIPGSSGPSVYVETSSEL